MGTISEAINAAVSIVRDWYAAESGGLGIANTGLTMAEHFVVEFPFSLLVYRTKGGGQVSGLSGARANEIVRRIDPTWARFGTESGRTSRGTPAAADRLANAFAAKAALFSPLTDSERRVVADAIQRWLVENPIREHFSRQRIKPDVDAGTTTAWALASVLKTARDRKVAGAVAQHLVGAKLQLRFPEIVVSNFGHTTADSVSGRSGDFQVNDAVFHVTVAPSPALRSKLNENLRDSYHPVVIVPLSRVSAFLEDLDSWDIADRVSTYPLEYFLAQNIDEIGEFSRHKSTGVLRQLFDVYNERIEAVETDRSIMVDIPHNLR